MNLLHLGLGEMVAIRKFLEADQNQQTIRYIFGYRKII